MFVYETLPKLALKLYADLSHNRKMQAQVEQLTAVQEKMINLQTIFFHFINNQWIYDSKFVDTFWKYMSPAEQAEF